MTNTRGASAAAAVAMIAFAAATGHAASIDIGTAEGAAGSNVTIEVSIRTMGATVEGTQNRIGFDRETPIAANDDGDPDCAVNAAIDKDGTAFRFLPLDCDPAADCTAVRVFVLSLVSTDPIPDGSVLYTCRIAIADDASEGTHVLSNGEARASGPLGATVPTTATDGAVEVIPEPVAAIEIGSASAEPGTTAEISVTLALLDDPPSQVAEVQHDFSFAAAAPIAAGENGQPICAVNDAIGKPDSDFDFLPLGCEPSVECTGVRATVAGDSTPIADGATLYTCSVAIPADTAAGTYDLTAETPLVRDPTGAVLPAIATDGAIEVVEPAPVCVGDCNDNGIVSIDELLIAVGVSLGSQPASACTAVDEDGDGQVAVNELVLAVRNALLGCQLS